MIKSGRRDGKFPRFGSTDPAQRNVWEWSAGLHPAAPLTPSMPGGRLETGDPSIRPCGWPVKPSEPHPTFITRSGTWVPPFLLSSVARLDPCSSRGSSVAPLNPNSEVAVSIMTRIARANFSLRKNPNHFVPDKWWLSRGSRFQSSFRAHPSLTLQISILKSPHGLAACSSIG